jgi:hypothetical protein
MTTVLFLKSTTKLFVLALCGIKEVDVLAKYTLLHVYEHSDMNLPTLSVSLKEVGNDVRDTLAFVRKNLGISEFILPAVYQGLFNRIYWMRRIHPVPSKERTLNVVSGMARDDNCLSRKMFFRPVAESRPQAAVFCQDFAWRPVTLTGL